MNNPTHVVFDSGLRLEQNGVKVHIEKITDKLSIDVQDADGKMLFSKLVPLWEAEQGIKLYRWGSGRDDS